METQPTVLLMEEERNFGRIVEAKLLKSGFGVEIAVDIGATLKALLRRPFQLTLLDIHAPHLDELAFVPLLRAAAPSTPFVVMTAYEDETLRRRALAAGVSEVLFKPFELNYLAETLRGLLVPSRIPDLYGLSNMCVVRVGQSLRMQTAGSPGQDLEGQVSTESGETFEVISSDLMVAAPGESVEIQIAGEDGLYAFRSRVLAPNEFSANTAALQLAKPTMIRRRQRRRFERQPCAAPVRISSVRLLSSLPRDRSVAVSEGTEDSASSSLLTEGMALNLSLAGIMAAVPTPLKVGEEALLALFLNSAEPLSLPCRIAWVEAVSPQASFRSPALFRIGARFGRLSVAARRQLETFLA